MQEGYTNVPLRDEFVFSSFLSHDHREAFFTIVFSSYVHRVVIGAIGRISPHEDNTN